MVSLLLLLFLLVPCLAAQPLEEVRPQKNLHTLEDVQEFIIRWVGSNGTDETQTRHWERVNDLSRRCGISLSFAQRGFKGYTIARVRSCGGNNASQILKRIASQSPVLSVEPNLIMDPFLEPNDPLYASQWHYKGATSSNYGTIYGMNLPGAWSVNTGSSSIIVAVLDSGIASHEDLNAKVLPGYDMVSNISMANDGDGRDGDPSDPGDWTYGDNGTLVESSWHGTHCAGTVAAVSNNGVGVAGVSWGAKILPVRCLGRGGGMLSDIADAIRWAAGLNLGNGIPVNVNKANVISMSLGGAGITCPAYMQSAINDAVATGAVIVAAAGNAYTDAYLTTPCNCDNVICVASHTAFGTLATYSNYGPKIDIMAPGGSLYTDTNVLGVLSTSNTGTTGPSTSTYKYLQGTSMACPHVAGLAALILSVNPTLSPAEVEQIIKRTAKPFINSGCDTNLCGAGLADASAAIRYATGPPMVTMTPTPTATRPVASYVCGAGVPLRNDFDVSADFTFPRFTSQTGSGWGRSTSVKYSGTGSLGVPSTGAPARVGLDFTASNTMVYIMTTRTTASSVSAVFSLLYNLGSLSNLVFSQVRFSGTTAALCQSAGSSLGLTCAAAGTVSAGRWYSIHLRLDYALGTTTLFIDGTNRVSLPWPSAVLPYSRITGFLLANFATDAVVYYDELQVECSYVAPPVFTPFSSLITDGTPISMATATSGAIICYTTNGTVPVCSTSKTSCSVGIKYTTPITKTSAMNGLALKAVACKYLYGDSDVVVMAIRAPPPSKTPTPTASPTTTSTVTSTHSPTPTQTPTITPTSTQLPTASATSTATITQLPTHTLSPTATPSPTFTQSSVTTMSPTASWSESFTATPTITPSSSVSQTSAATPSPIVTQTGSFTRTPTITQLPTTSVTSTATITQLPTHTLSPTAIPSPTITQSPVATESPTASRSQSLTATPTITPSPSVTQSDSATPSPTATQTDSPAMTLTITQLPTISATFTATANQFPTTTPSNTVTQLSTASQPSTATLPPTITQSPVITESFTVSQTGPSTMAQTTIPSPTATPTPIATHTESSTATPRAIRLSTTSETPTASITPSFTATPSPAATQSPTTTSSSSPTPSSTASVFTTGTPSTTAILSPTATRSPTATSSLSATPSPIFIMSSTANQSPTPTSSSNITVTSSDTSTVTFTSTQSLTVNATPTTTASATPTSSATLEVIVTVTPTTLYPVPSPSQFFSSDLPSDSPSIAENPVVSPSTSSSLSNFPSESPRASESSNPTPSPLPPSPIHSMDPSSSRSPPASPQASPSQTQNHSPSPSPSRPPQPIETRTETSTLTITATVTSSIAATQSDSSTVTPSTVTPSSTVTSSSTQSLTASAKSTATSTQSATNTQSIPLTASPTSSSTASATATSTKTARRRIPGETQTTSYTATDTASQTRTSTSTTTSTSTRTATPTVTTSQTITTTPSHTFTSSRTATTSPSRTASFTHTSTPTLTSTDSYTSSLTLSSTATATDTLSPTATTTATITLASIRNAANTLHAFAHSVGAARRGVFPDHETIPMLQIPNNFVSTNTFEVCSIVGVAVLAATLMYHQRKASGGNKDEAIAGHINV